MAPDQDDGWDDFDEGLSWADPAIRQEYEAALGRLILVHNEVDLRVTRLIERCLRRLSDPPALSRMTHGLLADRLRNLELLQALPIELGLSHLDIAKLHQLNSDRNVVAHGHFEQNPFDGDYVLIRAKQRFSDYPTERLESIAHELQYLARYLSALVDFYDPPVPPPDSSC